MRDNFLWAAATAAHQIEDGLKGTTKGLSVSDVLTQGSSQQLREITDTVEEGKIYPKHEAVKHDTHQDISETVNLKNSHIIPNEHLEHTDWGWQIAPVGIRFVLNTFYYHYQKQIFIVEKGLGALGKLEGDTVRDQYRIDFLAAYIKQMKIAIEEDGVDVIGYTPQSAIDMISFSTGETKERYGFIYVDNDSEDGDYKRYKKQSFDWYKKVIEMNGEVLQDEVE